jgi:flagellar biogenesis protein FliO
VIVCASGALGQEPTGAPNPTEAAPRGESSAEPGTAPAPEQPPPSTWDKNRGQEGDGPAAEPDEEISWTAQLAKTVVALLFVVALIYFLFKVGLARLLGYATVRSGSKALAIVDRAQLDARHALYLVELGPKHRLLLGTGEQGVQLLARVDEAGRSIGEPPTSSFSDAIAKSADPTRKELAHHDGGSDEAS